ncbi:pentatricopeptide repeat-containing protein At1g08070, chloroplastic-like [Daucus carota subsp. sativus]
MGDIDSAKQVFNGVVVKDSVCYNCLISGYSKAGDVEKARLIFDEMEHKTVVSWNSMLSCYAHNGDYSEVFRIFERMQIERCRANEYTVVMLLSVRAKLGDLDMGCRVKNFIDENKLCTNIRVSTALLEMFAKCGDVDEARRVFNQMVGRDVVAWSAMNAGYAQNGRSSEALELFELMKGQQVKPNDATIVSVLSACAQLGSVEAGESIGSFVESRCLDLDLRVASALLGMYSKCGNIDKARKVFEKMPQKDVVTWNIMIMGLAINGFAEDAIAHYEKMKDIVVKPDEITFLGLLTACVHAGLLELGLHFFEMMRG